MNSIVELDGSQGEGGGQILRTSLALSLVSGRPFHLANVRARRKPPGLRPQHLMSVQAAAQIGQAKVRGASQGSTDLVFEPGTVVPGTFHFAIGTAGATSLVLHTVYLPLALAGGPSRVTIEGGTHVKASPCFHFLDATWRGYLRLIGVEIALTMHRPGFYPRGGGLLQADIKPCSGITGLNYLEFPPVEMVQGISAVSGLPMEIADRQARRARQRLRKLGLKVDITEEAWPGGPGTVLTLTLPTKPVPTLFFGLGERGKPAERVADEAVDQLALYLEAEPLAMDEHSADQLVLPLVLATGSSAFRVTRLSSHLRTNVDTIHHFLDRPIQLNGAEDGPGLVQID